MADERAHTALRIYLSDHRAGAEAGLRLARRCHGNNPEGPLGDFLSELVGELVEDRAALLEIAERLACTPNPIKMVLGRAAEVAGRVKVNERVLGYSPLSRLVELEGLASGIDAKRSLWESLRRLDDSRLMDAEVDALSQRAASQRDRLEPHRLDAARAALAGGHP